MTYIHDKTGGREIAMHVEAMIRIDAMNADRRYDRRFDGLIDQSEVDVTEALRVPYADQFAGCDPQMWAEYHAKAERSHKLAKAAAWLFAALVVGVVLAAAQETYGAYIVPGAW